MTDFDCLIIGGGPAGITAAIYLKRANKKVAIIEKFVPGGQLNLIGKVENYPGVGCIEGVDLAVKLYEQANSFDIPFIYEEAREYILDGDVKRVICNRNNYSAKTIIFALGCFSKPLNIKGEDKFKGSGVSYCAVCDGNFFKGKRLAVVGSGDSAISDCLYLSNLASEVLLICEKLQPVRLNAKILEGKNNVKILQETKVLEILGDKEVNSIKIERNGSEETIEIDAIFVAIGRMPDTKALVGKLDLDKNGYILTDPLMHTSQKGVFACGDVRDGVMKQIATAVGDGAIAAAEAIKCL